LQLVDQVAYVIINLVIHQPASTQLQAKSFDRHNGCHPSTWEGAIATRQCNQAFRDLFFQASTAWRIPCAHG
jgi:hypothetical protein